MKSRRWIAAAALAAAVVFLVMVTGEHGPAAPDAAPAPVSSSEAVLASDGGPAVDDARGGGADEADRDEVIGALQGLLDALGVSADELAEGAENSADCGNGGTEKSGNGGAGSSANGNGGKASGGCAQSGSASSGRSDGAKITIVGFAFGQPLTVAPGATVEVVNTDAATHNVTAADGSFETPDLKQGDTATITAPATPGRYEYSCTLHPEMTGTLIVEGGGQRRSRSSEPADGSGGNEKDGSRQHQTTAPGREGGSSDGY